MQMGSQFFYLAVMAVDGKQGHYFCGGRGRVGYVLFVK